MARKTTRKRGRPPQPRAQYRRVMEDMLAKIRSGEWAPGSVVPPLRKLAENYGVGVNTVRLALDALKAEARLGLNARRRTVVLRRQTTKTVQEIMVLEILSNFLDLSMRARYFRDMQLGVLTGVGEWLGTLVVSGNPRYQNAIPQDGLDLPVKGVIVCGHFDKAVLKRYEKFPVPVVLMDHPGDAWKMHACSVDNENAASAMTERLIRWGHKRIAFLRSVLTGVREVDPDSRARQRGYEKAMRKAGLYDKGLIVNFTTSDRRAEAPGVRSILSARPAITAAVAVDASLGSMLRNAAVERGRKLPHDLSIVTFQEKDPDNELFTGMCFDFEELGRRAVRLLRDPGKSPQRSRVPGEWVDAGTAGPVTVS